MRIRLIGIGTGHGDDAAGLLAAAALREQPLPPQVSVHSCERPLPDLLDLLEDLRQEDAVVLLDALRGDEAPGAVRCLQGPDLANVSSVSTHGLGPPQILVLHEALRGPLPRVTWIGIGVGRRPGTELSPAVRAGAREASRRVVQLLPRLLGAADGLLSRDASGSGPRTGAGA